MRSSPAKICFDQHLFLNSLQTIASLPATKHLIRQPLPDQSKASTDPMFEWVRLASNHSNPCMHACMRTMHTSQAGRQAGRQAGKLVVQA